MTVPADSATSLSLTANGIVDMRGGAAVLAGTFAYDGPNLVTDWYAHDLHQLEYAFKGTIEVETDAAHYLLPPQQAAWIPAGLLHRSTLSHFRTVSVFFAPHMVPDNEGRARLLAAAPVIREMILYGVRWPISRPTSNQSADSFFAALALLVLDWFEHETPLSLPTAKDPLLQAVMDHTNANLARVTLADVCRTVRVSRTDPASSVPRRDRHDVASVPLRESSAQVDGTVGRAGSHDPRHRHSRRLGGKLVRPGLPAPHRGIALCLPTPRGVAR